MQYGKFVVKTKPSKYHKKEFEKDVEAKKEHDRLKHKDKALYRAKREEEQEDFGGFHIDDGY